MKRRQQCQGLGNRAALEGRPTTHSMILSQRISSTRNQCSSRTTRRTCHQICRQAQSRRHSRLRLLPLTHPAGGIGWASSSQPLSSELVVPLCITRTGWHTLAMPSTGWCCVPSAEAPPQGPFPACLRTSVAALQHRPAAGTCGACSCKGNGRSQAPAQTSAAARPQAQSGLCRWASCSESPPLPTQSGQPGSEVDCRVL